MRNDSPSSLEGLNFGFAEEIHTHPPDTDTSYTDTNTEELSFLGSYTADNDTVFLQEAVPSYDENTEHSLSINEQNIPSELSSRQPLTTLLHIILSVSCRFCCFSESYCLLL